MLIQPCLFGIIMPKTHRVKKAKENNLASSTHSAILEHTSTPKDRQQSICAKLSSVLVSKATQIYHESLESWFSGLSNDINY